MGKQAGFFTLYAKLQPVFEAIYDVLQAADDRAEGELESALNRVKTGLADRQLNLLGDEPLAKVRSGAEILTLWLTSEPWLTDVEVSDRQLESGADQLRHGGYSLEEFQDRMARRAFGYWGAYFFSWLKVDNDICEMVVESLPLNRTEDIEALLTTDDLPDEPVDIPPKIVLTPRQRDIMKALDGKAFKKEDLAARVCGGSDNGNILYRPGGIGELLREGFVVSTRGIGYWRPDRPPMEHLDILFPGRADRVKPVENASEDQLPASTSGVDPDDIPSLTVQCNGGIGR